MDAVAEAAARVNRSGSSTSPCLIPFTDNDNRVQPLPAEEDHGDGPQSHGTGAAGGTRIVNRVERLLDVISRLRQEEFISSCSRNEP